MLACFPLKLGRCSLQSLCLYGHASCKFSTCALGGWYLDCSRGFVPDAETKLYNNLVSSALEVIEVEDEPEEDNPTPPSNEKNVASVKGKGKGRKLVPLASSQVSTRFFTKALVQRTVGPATTMVGSPTVTPYAPLPSPIAAPSHSGATIPSVPRKRRVVVPDASATSSERLSSFFFD